MIRQAPIDVDANVLRRTVHALPRGGCLHGDGSLQRSLGALQSVAFTRKGRDCNYYGACLAVPRTCCSSLNQQLVTEIRNVRRPRETPDTSVPAGEAPTWGSRLHSIR